MLFAPLAYLPFALTFLCWTLLNGLLLWYALDRLLPEREATVALALLYLEVLLALQYGQSNALVAALMILAFVAFEARRPAGAATSITLGAAVKLFPLAAASLAVFHPRRLRFAAIFIAVLAAAIALPLVAIPPGDLLAQYRSWHAIEAKDALRRGYSLMHYVHAWFGLDWPDWPLQAAGTALLLLPVALRPDRWASLEFRRLFLCSLLVYSVPFNHASESPSFVVAYAGIMIWYVSSQPCADGRDGPDAARDGRTRRGRGAALGEVRLPGPLPDQGHSLPRRVVRDAVGAARHSPLDGAD